MLDRKSERQEQKLIQLPGAGIHQKLWFQRCMSRNISDEKVLLEAMHITPAGFHPLPI
jgi:hypothetical protein